VCSADDGHVDADRGVPGERPQIASAILRSVENPGGALISAEGINLVHQTRAAADDNVASLQVVRRTRGSRRYMPRYTVSQAACYIVPKGVDVNPDRPRLSQLQIIGSV
jgi:hypothetical protein